jgi:hypothetical protein
MSIPEWKSREKLARVFGRAANPEKERFLIQVQIQSPRLIRKVSPADRGDSHCWRDLNLSWPESIFRDPRADCGIFTELSVFEQIP